MSAIGKAIGPLVNIALLLLFAIIIFAIIGLEFYAGALNSTCYSLEDLGKHWHDRLVNGKCGFYKENSGRNFGDRSSFCRGTARILFK